MQQCVRVCACLLQLVCIATHSIQFNVTPQHVSVTCWQVSTQLHAACIYQTNQRLHVLCLCLCLCPCVCAHHDRLWLQALPLRSGLVPPSAAAARQAAAGAGSGSSSSDAFKQLRRVVVQSGRVARPGAKGQREEWAVKFQGINNREQVGVCVCVCGLGADCVHVVGWWDTLMGVSKAKAEAAVKRAVAVA